MSVNELSDMYKVLIVDDEPFIRQGLSIIIDWEKYGFIVNKMASNGVEALEIIEKEEFDLLIIDIRMPEMDGIRLIKNIKERNLSNAEIILLSSYYEFEYAKEAIRYNVTDYILKPVQKDELIKVLSEIKEKITKLRIEENEAKRMHFERNIVPIIWGKFDEINLEQSKKYLKCQKNLRYIDIEISQSDKKFNELSENEKRILQRKIFCISKDFLGEECYHVVFDVTKDEKCYDIGLIYVKKLAEEKNVLEKEYINLLMKSFKDFEYKVSFHVGKKVDDICKLSESYKTAKIANFMDNIGSKAAKSILYYEEISEKRPQVYMVDIEKMNNLVRFVEENEVEFIENAVKEIYAQIIEYSMDYKMVNISISYILGCFLQLAREQDECVDQEEIMEYISKGAASNFVSNGSEQYFTKFAIDFSNYLNQLRRNTSMGVVGNLAKDIEENYMYNLSLKEFGEKYFINSAYLGQLFKKKFGQSFKEYLNNCRIEKACEMLIRTDKKVYMIAEEVGYHNIDYFINKFVLTKGKTPYQYRKEYFK